MSAEQWTDDEWEEQYEREMCAYPLLTSSEERALGARVWRAWHVARWAPVYFATGSKSLGAILAWSLVDMIDAAHTLVHHNLRLVVGHVRKLLGGATAIHGLSYLDLVQEGNGGLLHAAYNFDYRRGFRFSTHATWWIRQAVGRAIDNKAHAIHLPVYVSAAHKKAKRLVRQYQDETADMDAVPPDEWLRERGMTDQDLRVWHEGDLPSVVSADAPVAIPSGDAPDPARRIDQIEGPPIAGSTDDVDAQEAARALVDTLRGILTDRERQIMELRGGYVTGARVPLEEVGRKLGITRERVRQLESDARRKLFAAGLQADGSVGAARGKAEVAALMAGVRKPAKVRAGVAGFVAKRAISGHTGASGAYAAG